MFDFDSLARYGAERPPPTVRADYTRRVNLKNLRRYDPDITDILDRASHVVLYRYEDADEDEGGPSWRKLEVEGAMFLTHRARAPHSSLFILNRCHTKNYVHFIGEQAQIQLTDALLLIREPQQTYGVWFHSAAEKAQMCAHVRALQARFEQSDREDGAPLAPAVAALLRGVHYAEEASDSEGDGASAGPRRGICDLLAAARTSTERARRLSLLQQKLRDGFQGAPTRKLFLRTLGDLIKTDDETPELLYRVLLA